MKKTATILGLALILMSIINVMLVEGSTSGTIWLEESIVNEGDEVIVYGENFSGNVSITINLMYVVGGNQIPNVANGTTDDNGTFNLSFSPEKTGKFFVIAIGKSSVAQATLEVLPKENPNLLTASINSDELKENEEYEFTVLSELLTDKNYILIFTDTSKNIDIVRYEVLHNGISVIEHTFQNGGNHIIKIEIEGINATWYNGYFVEESEEPNTNTNLTENYNISISITGTSANIQVFDDSGSTINDGTIVIINPEGQISTKEISYGIANINLDIVGKYTFKYILDKENTIEREYEYNPKIQLSVSDFNDEGLTYLTLYIDERKPSGERNVKVIKPDGNEFITLYNGEGNFQAQETGTYKFQLTGNFTQSTSKTWSENKLITGLTAKQDGDYLIVSGTVRGELSNQLQSDVSVSIQIAELGSKTVSTDSNGFFHTSFDVSENKGSLFSENTLTVSANADNTEETNVGIKANWGDYTFYYVVIVIIFLIVAYTKGWLYQWTNKQFKFLNPKKKGAKGSTTPGGFHRTNQFR